MKKMKIASVLTACAIFCGTAAILPGAPETASITASAEEAYTEGTYELLTYQNYGDYIVITDCDASAAEVEIPSEIDGVPVTRIESYAFSQCVNLASISIPDSVTSIGGFAFSNTPWIEEKRAENPLVIVNGILIDGTDCSGDVVIPDNVENIGAWAFYSSFKVTSVTIPDSVTIISDFAFSGCTGLTSVGIPDSVTSIGQGAFKSCSRLSSIDIPDSVTNIGANAFMWCDGLNSVTIPASVTSIGSNAFACCARLTAINVDPANNDYESVNGVLFNEAKDMLIQYPTGKIGSNYIIPDSVMRIETSVFQGCTRLTSIIIPDTVTCIDSYTFSGCSSLPSIVIPDSVTSIEAYAFGDCTSLTDVYYTGTEEEWNAMYIHESNECIFAATIHYNYVPEPITPGNLNDDATIDATDAAVLLQAAALAGTGADSGLTVEQEAAADLSGDGAFDASDASLILMYAAYSGAGGVLGIEDYLAAL